jgi:heme exporter protein D
VVPLPLTWVAIDFRRQQQRLRELEQSGVSRRSGRAVADIK